MWPFSRNAETKNTEKPSFEQEIMYRIADWRSVGGTFEYLGRTMIVTRHHCLYSYEQMLNFPDIRSRPAITVDYVDNVGVIHNITFCVEELLALIAKDGTHITTKEN